MRPFHLAALEDKHGRPEIFNTDQGSQFRDIVGLYVDPPAHAVVLSVDEKSQIQALDGTQPPEHIRPRGKTGDLAFGFAGGKGSYRALAPDDPATDEEVEQYKDAWRRAHPKTCQFWREIEAAAIEAMQNIGKVCPVGAHISWCYDGGDFLCMTLPSGRVTSSTEGNSDGV